MGGGSNYQALGGEKLKKELLSVIEQLIKNNHILDAEITHIYMGLAGAGRKSDQDAIAQLFSDTNYGNKISIVSDAVIALAGAFSNRPGIILIAGTGSICFGMDSTGNLIRSGGWGYLLGEEGSGYYIGREALIAALKDFDGRGEKTSLRSIIENRFNIASIDLIIPLVYQNKIDRVAIADITPVVFEEAAKGDSVAENIVKNAGYEQGKLAKAVIRRMQNVGDEIPMALIGSIFKQKEALIPFVEKELSDLPQKVHIVEPEHDPAIGAALRALFESQVNVDDSILRKLKEL